MTPQQKAKYLVEKARKATTYKYQEYAGANYSTFEHDTETLNKIALIAVEEILDMKIVRKDEGTDEYWESVKDELYVSDYL